ncbi:MAG: hypothetical protein WBV81_08005 [Ignavibacteriaceae bacterium]
MKIIGYILTVLGAAGLIISVINYSNQTDKFNLFGLNITVSQGSIMPIIITGIVLILGIIITISSKN